MQARVRPLLGCSLARQLSDRPLAVNLLLPFARRGHFKTTSEADVLSPSGGAPRRRTPKIWLRQCGSVEEALAARAAGAIWNKALAAEHLPDLD